MLKKLKKRISKKEKIKKHKHKPTRTHLNKEKKTNKTKMETYLNNQFLVHPTLSSLSLTCGPHSLFLGHLVSGIVLSSPPTSLSVGIGRSCCLRSQPHAATPHRPYVSCDCLPLHYVAQINAALFLPVTSTNGLQSNSSLRRARSSPH